MAVAVLLFATSWANAQEPYVFMEGSVHSFSVTDNPASTFAWSMAVDPFNNIDLDPSAYDLIDGGLSNAVTVRFMDMNRAASELVYLVVQETAPNGCSTRRALQIQLEPNNMYLEFASATTQDCFNMGDFYAPLKVGLNFLDKAAGVPIPESRFPIQVSYEIRNITDGGPAIAGNSGAPLVLGFDSANDYYLLVTEAVGELTRTVEYELTITEVTDKYQAAVNNNADDIRMQIRVINHLPQSGGMDMALAYELTPIKYMGQL